MLSSDLISKIKPIRLRAKLIVEGFLTGLHKSPYHGFSVEFKDHRSYNKGDEIRFIDWKVYARTDRFYVRRFEDETNLISYVVLDNSASMGYTENKFNFAKDLAAAIAYLLYLQRDAFGLVVFNEKIETLIPPRTSRVNLNHVMKTLDNLETRGKTSLSSYKILPEKLKKRGMVVFISDMLVDPEEIISSLRMFRYRKHEVLAFHLLSSEELKIKGRARIFEDMESGEKVPFDPVNLKKEYNTRLHKHISTLKKELRKSNIDYEFFRTDEPIEFALYRFFKKRERLL